MIEPMASDVWLHRDEHFTDGRELFRSDRRFSVWAYTVSHSQLLVRSRLHDPAGNSPSRIDILFKPVEAMKIRADYDGLVIRCATSSEREQIFTRAGVTGSSHRALILEAPAGPDYVITAAFGWREDHRDERDPSDLAFFPPGTDPARLLPQEAFDTQP